MPAPASLDYIPPELSFPQHLLDKPSHVLVEPWIAERLSAHIPSLNSKKAHNSWITLSKLIIENNREAIAAPEISASVTILNSEAVFFTVAGERSVGTG